MKNIVLSPHDNYFPFRSKNKDRIGAVILENTFTSIPDIAKILFPFKFIKMLPGMKLVQNYFYPKTINQFWIKCQQLLKSMV